MQLVQFTSDKGIWISVMFENEILAQQWLASHGFERSVSDRDWIRRTGCQIIVRGMTCTAPRLYATVLPLHDISDISFRQHPQAVLAYSSGR